MQFSKSLKLNHIFRRLYAAGGHGNKFLVLYARKNKLQENRVGVTVSKKLGKAVVRNRVRRRLRPRKPRFTTIANFAIVADSSNSFSLYMFIKCLATDDA